MPLLRLEERAVARLGLALQDYGLMYQVGYHDERHLRLISTGKDALLVVVAGPQAVAG